MVDVPALTWMAPDGDVVPLSWFAGKPWHLMPGVKGLSAAPRTLTSDPSYRGGVVLRNTVSTARRLTVPLHIGGVDHGDYTTNLRYLVDKFTQTDVLGVGEMMLTRPDGTRRCIGAVYESGFVEGDANLGVVADTVALTLLCPKPWWRDASPVTVSRAFDPTARSFLSPFPAVSTSTALGTTTITNPGGVLVWPDWSVIGPASLITAANNRTGESWTIDPVAFRGSPLAPGEMLTITTDPPTVRGPMVAGSANWVGALNWPGAVLWGLQRGTSQIAHNVQGAGVGTTMTMTFYARYETA